MLSETCQSYVGQNTTVRPLRANVTLDSSLASWDSITKLSTYDGIWVAENKSSITEHYTQCLENAG
jgi:iron(III) transport system substrate-binding protein